MLAAGSVTWPSVFSCPMALPCWLLRHRLWSQRSGRSSRNMEVSADYEWWWHATSFFPLEFSFLQKDGAGSGHNHILPRFCSMPPNRSLCFYFLPIWLCPSVHCQVICTKTWLQVCCFLLKMWQNLGSPNGPNFLAISPTIPLCTLSSSQTRLPYCFLNSPCAFSCCFSLLPL